MLPRPLSLSARAPFPYSFPSRLIGPLRPRPCRIKRVRVGAPPSTAPRPKPRDQLSYSSEPRGTMEGQSRAVAPSYLGWSIFNTLCCCLPLGIAAIVYSCRVGCSFVLTCPRAAPTPTPFPRTLIWTICPLLRSKTPTPLETTRSPRTLRGRPRC